MRLVLLLMVVAACALAAEPAQASPRLVLPIDEPWLFQLVDSEAVVPDPQGWKSISLPHIWNEDDSSQEGDP